MPARESKKLRDPVHKDIILSAEEMRILDTPAVQRLRRIRQLGTAYLVYPGANHTRFEHGVGSCWMAKNIMRRLLLENPESLSRQEQRAVAIAALIHDVTHVPFGHTIEDERRLFQRHDEDPERFQHFFLSGPLGAEIERTGLADMVLGIVAPDDSRYKTRACLRQIVAGTICADLLDYLKRDNYFCGLSYYFDERLFHYFRITNDNLVLELKQHGIFRHDALSEITNLLRIRYILTERVYYHHAKIASGVMISKALEQAVHLGFKQQELCSHSDETLLFALRERYCEDAGISFLIDSFKARRLFKRCYMVARRITPEQQQRLVRDYHYNYGGVRTTAEHEIAHALGIKDHEVAIYCPPAGMALKEAEVPVTVGKPRIRSLSDFNSEEIGVLQDKHRSLWRFYVFISPDGSDRIERAGRAAEEVIGLPNELPAEKRGRFVEG